MNGDNDYPDFRRISNELEAECNRLRTLLRASEEAKARLRAVIPHLKIAVEMAKLQVGGGKVELGVIASNTKEGRIAARFEFEQFLADLEAVSATPTTPGGGM
jgi:hypothetical protein